MKLNFIGRGNFGNTELGNNAAYIRLGADMLLIDCGEDVASKIKEGSLLNGLDNLVIAITHMHPDHVGSLTSLIFEASNTTNIVIVVGEKIKQDMEDFIRITGAEGLAIVYGMTEGEIVNLAFGGMPVKLSCRKTEHFEPKLFSYSFMLETSLSKILYTGDTNQVPSKEDLERFNLIYQDCSSTKSEAHCYIDDLIEAVPREFRDKVRLMHVDNLNRLQAKSVIAGFRTVIPD